MKKIKLEIELLYDEELMYGEDLGGKDWFYNHVLMPQTPPDGLILHSNFVSYGEVGEVRVTKILSEEPTQ